jgi:hypothetical protein
MPVRKLTHLRPVFPDDSRSSTSAIQPRLLMPSAPPKPLTAAIRQPSATYALRCSSTMPCCAANDPTTRLPRAYAALSREILAGLCVAPPPALPERC